MLSGDMGPGMIKLLLILTEHPIFSCQKYSFWKKVSLGSIPVFQKKSTPLAIQPDKKENAYKLNIDSNRSSKVFRGFKIFTHNIYCEYLSPSDRLKHWWSKKIKASKNNKFYHILNQLLKFCYMFILFLFLIVWHQITSSKILSLLLETYLTALTEWVACSVKLGCVKPCSVQSNLEC